MSRVLKGLAIACSVVAIGGAAHAEAAARAAAVMLHPAPKGRVGLLVSKFEDRAIDPRAEGLAHGIVDHAIRAKFFQILG